MKNFFASLAAIFRPPFPGLGLVLVIYYVWAHLMMPDNDVLRGNFPDPDDYTYLNQTLDWLRGQGWYDNIQHRLNAPDGVPIHFSRLAQIPMAAGMLALNLVGLPLQGAATLVGWIYPVCLLGLMTIVLRRAAANLVPAHWAGAVNYPLLFSCGLLYAFMPGHVDHHGLGALLLAATLGLCLYQMVDPDDWRAPVAAGAIMALALTIALEALPWILTINAVLGLRAAARGGSAARGGFLTATVFFVGSVGGLLLTRPPHNLAVLDILSYSAVYVLLALAVFVPFAGVWAADRRGAVARWAVGGSLAVCMGFLFFHQFPELVTGPYGAVDPRMHDLLLNRVSEAQPLVKTNHGWWKIMAYLSLSLISLGFALASLARAKGEAVWKWALLAAVQTVLAGLTLFYQYRFLGLTASASLLPLTAALYSGWQRIAALSPGRGKTWAEIGLLMALGPLPAVLIPSLFDHRSFSPGVTLFVVDGVKSSCDMARLEHILRDPKGLGAQSLTVLSTMDAGPEILFRSNHKVLAAPYHMNVSGNLDVYDFLSSRDEKAGAAILSRRTVDAIVLCRYIAAMYVADGDKDNPTLAARMLNGKVPPGFVPLYFPKGDLFMIMQRVGLPIPPGAQTSPPKQLEK